VIVSNAGYGLFGATIATNLLGSIQLIRGVLPLLRAQGGGRVIQISSCGGQVAFLGNSMYHATKWGIEGFVESVAQEVAFFGIGSTIVEPGGARTEFRYGSAQVAELMPVYDDTPAHGFLRMLDPECALAPGDPARMASRIRPSRIRHDARHPGGLRSLFRTGCANLGPCLSLRGCFGPSRASSASSGRG